MQPLTNEPAVAAIPCACNESDYNVIDSKASPRNNALNFVLPSHLEASEPPEARGLERDTVRLMVSRIDDDRVLHTRFRCLPDVLKAGDTLVVNTSGTMPASVPAIGDDKTLYAVHLSTELPAGLWIVEIRKPRGITTAPFLNAHPGMTFSLAGGGKVTLLTPHDEQLRGDPSDSARLWIATLDLNAPVSEYLDSYGRMIRYNYVDRAWSPDYYQTVFANEPGSSEMPSAGRGFTTELVTRLASRGIRIAPLLLNTGVASLEAGETPYEEYYRVSRETADLVNASRAEGHRVLAIGTTAVRAIESVADETGTVHPGSGWTNLIITPERPPRAVDGLLTGFHEPQASHLRMLEAFAGRSHLEKAYHEALDSEYLWHEFGDLHLLIP
jgi:S-adenosylmethionine:tRNA ribosyltransferase-isomerase